MYSKDNTIPYHDFSKIFTQFLHSKRNIEFVEFFFFQGRFEIQKFLKRSKVQRIEMLVK